MQTTLDHNNATNALGTSQRAPHNMEPPPKELQYQRGEGCITQLPTRTYQTCQTLLLHLPEPSMSLPL